MLTSSQDKIKPQSLHTYIRIKNIYCECHHRTACRRVSRACTEKKVVVVGWLFGLLLWWTNYMRATLLSDGVACVVHDCVKVKFIHTYTRRRPRRRRSGASCMPLPTAERASARRAEPRRRRRDIKLIQLRFGFRAEHTTAHKLLPCFFPRSIINFARKDLQIFVHEKNKSR